MRLSASYAADLSYVDVNGYDFLRPGLRINPGFMQFARRGGETPRELYQGVQAGCVRTQRPWDSTFAKPRLVMNLRRNP